MVRADLRKQKTGLSRRPVAPNNSRCSHCDLWGSLWPDCGSWSSPSLLLLLALPQLLLFSRRQAEHYPRAFARAMSGTYINCLPRLASRHRSPLPPRPGCGEGLGPWTTTQPGGFLFRLHPVTHCSLPGEGGWAEVPETPMLELWGDLEPPLLLIPPPFLPLLCLCF